MDYNVILVLNAEETRVLMCVRRKDPYRGMLNFVGGKIKPGEDSLEAAYRELFEETAISKNDISLSRIITFTYELENARMEAYVGRLKNDVPVYGEENELLWVDADSDFSDLSRFAGCGNVYHMIHYYRKFKPLVEAAGKPAPNPRPGTCGL